MKKEYCEKCHKLVEYEIQKREVIDIYNDMNIKYYEIYNVCKECKNIFYNAESNDYNVITYGDEIRKLKDIITTTQIKEIMNKYNIGQKPLSKVLGFSEVTITRYLDGQNPDKVHSEILKEVLNNPDKMKEYLIKNKILITDTAYKKVMSKLALDFLEENKSKIYLISKYIINKIGDITPLALQKLLYFYEGFSLNFYNEGFMEKCECWAHGPVYRDIYNRFSSYRYEKINEDFAIDFSLIENKEIQLINEIIKSFGIYNGKILEFMTHKMEIYNSKKSNQTISKKEMKEYFKNIINDHSINSIKDISKYSSFLFKEIKYN